MVIALSPCWKQNNKYMEWDYNLVKWSQLKELVKELVLTSTYKHILTTSNWYWTKSLKLL